MVDYRDKVIDEVSELGRIACAWLTGDPYNDCQDLTLQQCLDAIRQALAMGAESHNKLVNLEINQ